MNKPRALQIFFLCLILTACTKQSVVLSESTCDAPCWRGITPGITNVDDSYLALRKMVDIQSETIISGYSTPPMMEEYIQWDFKDKKEWGGNITFYEKRSNLIFFGIDGRISLKQLISKFGEPENVFVVSTKGDFGSYLTVNIIYSRIGVCLHHSPLLRPLFFSTHYLIQPWTGIRGIYFLDPNIVEGQLEVGCLRGLDVNTYNNHVQLWKGYGNYEIYKR